MEQSFDKRTLLAFGLIAVIVFGWLWFFSPKADDKPAGKKTDSGATTAVKAPDTNQTATTAPPQQLTPAPALLPEKYQKLTAGAHRYITIKTPTYTAILNSIGGTIARFELNNYKKWDDSVRVQLICDSTGYPGELGIDYTATNGARVATDVLNFTIDAPETITLKGGDSTVVTARLALGADTAADAPAIEKKFVFKADSYGIGLDVTMRNMGSEVSGGHYNLTWKKGLKFQEHNSVEEASRTHAYVTLKEDGSKTIDASSPSAELVTDTTKGDILWAGLKTKYFAAAIIPATPLGNTLALTQGQSRQAANDGLIKTYNLSLQVPLSAQPVQTNRFTVFVGPLEYDVAKSFGLESMVEFGWKLVVRPIAEFFMLPIFGFLHSFIGNWGVVIIVFSLIIRLLLWPLSIPQIKSSRKMQLLQPKIAELKAKYAGEQQKVQMETMALYKEYGINPLGGCLPLLLQMPILYALYGTLSTAITLRQANFAFGIHDLSIPDVLITLPGNVPLLGSHLSGLAILMGAAMLIQQRMLTTDPSQKMMVYMMPVLLTLMFNNLPSGLNLYYFTFNLLSIGQQLYLTKLSKNTMTLDQMRQDASKKKKGWFSQKFEEAQKMAQMQRGDSKVNGRTPVEQRKRL